MPLAEYRTYFQRHVRDNRAGGVPQRRPLRAPLQLGALGHLGRDRSAGRPRRTGCSRSAAHTRCSATSCGRSPRRRSASGGARSCIDPLLYLGKHGALAQLRGGLRRRRARAAVAAGTAPTCCRSTSFRSSASGVRAEDGGDPAPAPRQRAERLDPPRDARPGIAARLGADARPSRSCSTTSSARARTRRARVGVWTRELIDAVLAVGGTYYLPYQPHATLEQFHAPTRAPSELFALKRRARPGLPLPQRARGTSTTAPGSIARTSTDAQASTRPSSTMSSATSALSDAFYRFLQNVFRTVPEDRFHHLISEACKLHRDEESIYRHIQRELPGIKPFLADLRYALPSLFKQKAEMARQTLSCSASGARSTATSRSARRGATTRGLRKALRAARPGGVRRREAADLFAGRHRGARAARKLGTHVPLDDYAPIARRRDRRRERRPGHLLHRPAPHDRPSSCEPFLASVHRACCGRAACSSCATTTCAREDCGRSCRWRTRSSTPASARRGKPTWPSCASSSRRRLGAAARRGRLRRQRRTASCRTTIRPTTRCSAS